jgi:hypothetical protein
MKVEFDGVLAGSFFGLLGWSREGFGKAKAALFTCFAT